MNVGKFIKSTAKSALSRIVDQVVDNVANGVARSGQLTAKSTAESLFNIGASYENVSSFAASKTDSVVSSGSPRFAAIAGKDITKTAAASIKQTRTAHAQDTSTYVKDINPQTAVELKRRKQTVDVIIATP